MNFFRRLYAVLSVKSERGKRCNIIRTFGEVAEARSGNNPPQAIIRLSASWEIR